MDMQHHEHEERCERYLLGQLSPEEKVKFEHDCLGNQERLDSLVRAEENLASLKSASEDFVLELIEKQARSPFGRSPLQLLAASSAAIVVAFGLGFFTGAGPSQTIGEEVATALHAERAPLAVRPPVPDPVETPAVTLPFIFLRAERSEPLQLPQNLSGAESIVVAFDASHYTNPRPNLVTIVTDLGQERYRFEGVEPNKQGAIKVLLPANKILGKAHIARLFHESQLLAEYVLDGRMSSRRSP